MKIDFNSLPSDDKLRIATFLRTADRLRSSDLFQGGLYGMKYTLSVNVDKNSVEEKFDRPPEKDVRDALLDVRKFVAKRETEFLLSVCNLIYQRLESQTIRDDLAKIRRVFKDSLSGLQGTSSVRVGFRKSPDDEPEYLEPEYVIDLYFNGHYFHSDPDKAPRLTYLEDRIGGMLVYSFLESITNIAQCIFYLASFIRREFELPDELHGATKS